MSGPDRLRFPRRLVIRLLEDATGEPAANIAMTLTLHARRKNDYHFAPSLSDSTGTINIDRDWVTSSIEETRNFFLMDYASTLEDCLPFVHLKVMSGEEIKRAIDAAQVYKAAKERLGVMLTVADLQNASNRAYELQEIRLSLEEPDVKIFEVPITLRLRSTAD